MNAEFLAKLERFERTCKEVEERYRRFDEKWQEREEEMAQRVADRVMDFVAEEQQEQERRKNNVVLFNVEETGEEGKDRKFCEDLFRDVDVRGVRVENTFRVGRRQEGKIRPLTVRLGDSEMKWKVVGKAKELKQYREYHRIGLVPDRTRRERETRERLRKEVLRKEREEGGRWTIRWGRVIRDDRYMARTDRYGPQHEGGQREEQRGEGRSYGRPQGN